MDLFLRITVTGIFLVTLFVSTLLLSALAPAEPWVDARWSGKCKADACAVVDAGTVSSHVVREDLYSPFNPFNFFVIDGKLKHRIETVSEFASAFPPAGPPALFYWDEAVGSNNALEPPRSVVVLEATVDLYVDPSSYLAWEEVAQSLEFNAESLIAGRDSSGNLLLTEIHVQQAVLGTPKPGTVGAYVTYPDSPLYLNLDPQQVHSTNADGFAALGDALLNWDNLQLEPLWPGNESEPPRPWAWLGDLATRPEFYGMDSADGEEGRFARTNDIGVVFSHEVLHLLGVRHVEEYLGEKYSASFSGSQCASGICGLTVADRQLGASSLISGSIYDYTEPKLEPALIDMVIQKLEGADPNSAVVTHIFDFGDLVTAESDAWHRKMDHSLSSPDPSVMSIPSEPDEELNFSNTDGTSEAFTPEPPELSSGPVEFTDAQPQGAP